jgi:hypothetical protein
MMDEGFEKLVIETVQDSPDISPYMGAVILEAFELGASTYGSRGDGDFSGIEDYIVSVQATIEEWHMDKFDNRALGYAVFMASRHKLTESEMKALAFIVDTEHFPVDSIERRQTPDFVAEDKYGIEVKSNENYSLSRKQLHSAESLSPFHIYLSTRTRVELLDVVDWIGLNEYQTVGGD